MVDLKRRRARQLAWQFIKRGDPIGWFEALYCEADRDATRVPWADQVVNPHLVEWAERKKLEGAGKRAIVVGCGLGDDAEELAGRGFRVVGFDISSTALEWCRQRFPDSPVEYLVEDLFASPESWVGAFDLVVEVHTLQVLPVELRPRAMERMVSYVAPGGTLLVVARGREPEEDPGAVPWPLTRSELDHYRRCGLREVSFEDLLDGEDPPVRRFMVEYRRPR